MYAANSVPSVCVSISSAPQQPIRWHEARAHGKADEPPALGSMPRREIIRRRTVARGRHQRHARGEWLNEAAEGVPSRLIRHRWACIGTTRCYMRCWTSKYVHQAARALHRAPSQSPSKSTVDVSFCTQGSLLSAVWRFAAFATGRERQGTKPHQQVIVRVSQIADENHHLRLIRNQVVQRHCIDGTSSQPERYDKNCCRHEHSRPRGQPNGQKSTSRRTATSGGLRGRELRVWKALGIRVRRAHL